MSFYFEQFGVARAKLYLRMLMIFYLYFPHLLSDFGEIQYNVSTKFLRCSSFTWYEYLPGEDAAVCSTSD